jgi:hypothetical protein
MKKPGGFSEVGSPPEREVQGCASILFELIVGRSTNGEPSIPTGISDFVSRMTKSGFCPRSRRNYSDNPILEILKQNDFEIDDGVHSAEVPRFVPWAESVEWPEKQIEPRRLFHHHRARLRSAIMIAPLELAMGRLSQSELME